VSEREYPVPRPRDDTDAVKDIARDLAEVASQISSFKGEANAYLSDPNYNALRLRLENAHAARGGRSGSGGGEEASTAQREPLGPGESVIHPTS
jgi:hypothetical protein